MMLEFLFDSGPIRIRANQIEYEENFGTGEPGSCRISLRKLSTGSMDKRQVGHGTYSVLRGCVSETP